MNKMIMNNGALYYAQGDKYLKQAIFSATSFKQHNKGIPVCLVTCEDGFKHAAFDIIKYISPLPHPFMNKVQALAVTPFERTLFLDTDTKVRKPLQELFHFLNGYDIGIARRAHCKWDTPDFNPILIDLHDKDMFNTGVIVYKKNPVVSEFLARWKALIQLDPQTYHAEHYCDQSAFSHIVNNQAQELGLSVIEIPNSVYNARPWIYAHLKKTGQQHDAKILHWHHQDAGFSVKLSHFIKKKLKLA